eukprot:jgi/Botrbrau1/8892/Bobra.0148s0012.1
MAFSHAWPSVGLAAVAVHSDVRTRHIAPLACWSSSRIQCFNRTRRRIRSCCLNSSKPLTICGTLRVNEEQEEGGLHGRLRLDVLALAVAGMLALAPPSFAELPTVPAEVALSAAKPLPRQEVKKGEIWLLFGVGAASIFGLSVLLESQERLFPAIVRANRTLVATRQASQEKELKEKLILEIEAQVPQAEDLQEAVLEGLAEARARSGAPATTRATQPDQASMSGQPDQAAARSEPGQASTSGEPNQAWSGETR